MRYRYIECDCGTKAVEQTEAFLKAAVVVESRSFILPPWKV